MLFEETIWFLHVLDSWIGGLVESSEESFLNSSLFAQDSRIGGIGGLMESSANLIFFSPFTDSWIGGILFDFFTFHTGFLNWWNWWISGIFWGILIHFFTFHTGFSNWWISGIFGQFNLFTIHTRFLNWWNLLRNLIWFLHVSHRVLELVELVD